MEIEVLERDPAFAVVACRAVVLLVWRGATTARGIERVHAQIRHRAASRPGPMVFLNVVAAQADRPPDEASRAAMRRAARDPEPGLAGVGTIHEADGFKGAFVRAFVSGIQRLQAGSFPVRVFRSPEEAAAWAAELLHRPEITPAALAEAVRVGREE